MARAKKRYWSKRVRTPRKFLLDKEVASVSTIKDWLREQDAWEGLEDWPEDEYDEIEGGPPFDERWPYDTIEERESDLEDTF